MKRFIKSQSYCLPDQSLSKLTALDNDNGSVNVKVKGRPSVMIREGTQTWSDGEYGRCHPVAQFLFVRVIM